MTTKILLAKRLNEPQALTADAHKPWPALGLMPEPARVLDKPPRFAAARPADADRRRA